MNQSAIRTIAGVAMMGLFAGSASAQCQHNKFYPTNAQANEFNFSAASIDFSRVALGRDDVKVGPNFNQGQTQFFIRQGIDWVSDGLVTGSDSGGGDHFGASVDIRGTTAVVGAPFHNVPGNPTTSEGAAYVFDWFLFGGWTQDIKLTAPTPQQGARFGVAVAMESNWIIVGAPFDDTAAGVNAGAVYVYKKVGGVWTFKQRLTNPVGAAGDLFGSDVDIDNTSIIVGSPEDTVAGFSGAGSMQIFEYDVPSDTWLYLETNNAASLANSEEFGGSVAILDNNLAIVGARLSTVSGATSAGSVSIFRRNAGAWTLEQTIPNPDTANIMFFGSDVGLSGDRAVISSTSPSAAYIYRETGGVWTLAETLTDPDGGSGQFGEVLAVHGHNLLLTDVADDDIAPGAGAAYVYTLDENGSDSCDTPRAVGFGSLVGCNEDATTDQPSGCVNSGKDIWYRMLIDCTGWYQVDTEGSNFDTVLSLYSGIDCPGTLIECDDDDGAGNSSLIQFFGVKGQFVKIRVAGFGVSPASGTFLLNTTRLEPFNNACAGAIAVSEGDHPFGTCLATTDGFSESTCNFFGDPQISQDVWFTYTASCSGTATFSLCGSDYDTEIAVYAGADCPAAVEIPLACNDDFCGSSSSVTFNVSAGQSYKVRVGGFGTNTGSGVMSISNIQTCPGDADGISPVGLGDIAVIISHWAQSATGCNQGDLSGNGTVGLEDIAIVINSWSTPCP